MVVGNRLHSTIVTEKTKCEDLWMLDEIFMTDCYTFIQVFPFGPSDFYIHSTPPPSKATSSSSTASDLSGGSNGLLHQLLVGINDVLDLALLSVLCNLSSASILLAWCPIC
jgi:hypothetical protein